jgi:tetratricopeptide (TPR) repeat protein
MYRFLVMSHFRFRKIPEALKSAEEGIAYTGKTGHHAMLLVIWCAKSLTHSIMDQSEEAQRAIDEAEKYIKDRKVVSIYHCAYLTAKVYVELADFKSCLDDKKTFKRQAIRLLKIINKLVRLSKKLRSAETEAFRLKAITFWFMDKYSKSLRHFGRSIAAGEKLNHNLELSRTYFELGKFLSDPKTGKTKLNGLTGTDYLEKAKNLFEEMDLQWDKERYEEYMNLKNRPVE